MNNQKVINTIKSKSNIFDYKKMKKDIRFMIPIYVDPENSRSMSPIIRVISKRNKKYLKNSIYNSYILKISYPITEFGAQIDNSMLVERDIYKNHVNDLILNNNTPNLAAYYYSTLIKSKFYRKLPNMCKPFYWSFAREMVTHQLDYKTEGKIFDFHNLNILAIEDLKGKDLTDWLSNSSFPKLKSIIFQVIYTLECMYQKGIRHNDLHDKNVFIVNKDTPKNLLYVTNYFENKEKFRVLL